MYNLKNKIIPEIYYGLKSNFIRTDIYIYTEYLYITINEKYINLTI